MLYNNHNLTSLICLHTSLFYLTHRQDPIWCNHSRSEWTWEQWLWRGIPNSPNLQASPSDGLMSYQDTRLTPLQRCSQHIQQSQPTGQRLFYFISWTVVGWGLIPLLRCSWCILQPQPTVLRWFCFICRTLVKGSHTSAVMQSVYSTALADWTKMVLFHIKDTAEIQAMYSIAPTDWALLHCEVSINDLK